MDKDDKDNDKKVGKKASKRASKKGASASEGSKLDSVRDLVSKMFEDDDDLAVKVDPEQFTESLPHITTTSIVLDHLIGGKSNIKGVSPCPGWPKGRFIQIYGPASCGKTTTCLHAAASVTRQGGVVGYLDYENEVIPSYAKSLGVPVDDRQKFQLFMPKTFEEGAAITWALAHAGVDLIIIDSIPAAIPKALVEKKVDEIGDRGQIGANAAAWSAFLPKLRPVCRKNNVTVLGISQVRANISGYGDPTTIPGGNAWQFYAALRVRLQRMKTVSANVYSAILNRSEEVPIGSWIRARLDKCKVSPQQGSEGLLFIRQGEGIDNIMSLMEIGKAYKVIQQKGSWYNWNPPNGDPISVQGEEKMWKLLRQDPLKLATLEKQIRPYLNGSVQATEDPEEESESEEIDSDAALAAVMAAINDATSAELRGGK